MPSAPPRSTTRIALLVALLAVGSVGALAAAGSGQSAAIGGDGTLPATNVSEAANRTNYLMPAGDANLREGYEHASVDVSAAVAVGAERLQGRLERGRLQRAWEGTSLAEKREVIDDELQAIRGHLDRLEERRVTLLEAYRNGSIDGRTFLRRLGNINVRAGDMERRLEAVQRLITDSISPPHISEYQTPLDNYRSTALTLQVPIAPTLLSALNGTAAPSRIYVLGGPTAFVGATASGGELTRVGYVDENRLLTGTDHFEAGGDRIISALNRFKATYPWADEHAIRNAQILHFGNTTVYRGQISHPQGQLTAYMDGRTESVYFETQRLRGETVPTTSSTRTETNSLVLTVNATAPTGPMRISLDQAGTMAPMNGTVRVGGTVVGTTDQSGTLWTVQPRGEFTVNATVDGDSVVVTGP